MSERTISSSDELREELEAVVDRTRDGPLTRDPRDEPTYSVPNADEPWSMADVLAEMMAGAHVYGTRVDLLGYRCYNSTVDDDLANVWTIHPSDGGEAIDALNLNNFATVSEVETYLIEGELRDRDEE